MYIYIYIYIRVNIIHVYYGIVGYIKHLQRGARCSHICTRLLKSHADAWLQQQRSIFLFVLSLRAPTMIGEAILVGAETLD